MKSFFDFLENYPLSLFGYERNDAYFKTDRYIDDEFGAYPILLYFALSSYPFRSFGYNHFYGF